MSDCEWSVNQVPRYQSSLRQEIVRPSLFIQSTICYAATPLDRTTPAPANCIKLTAGSPALGSVLVSNQGG
jgi:hypothetical protein